MKQGAFFDSLHGKAVLPPVKRTCRDCIYYAKKGETPTALCILTWEKNPEPCSHYEAFKR